MCTYQPHQPHRLKKKKTDKAELVLPARVCVCACVCVVADYPLPGDVHLPPFSFIAHSYLRPRSATRAATCNVQRKAWALDTLAPWISRWAPSGDAFLGSIPNCAMPWRWVANGPCGRAFCALLAWAVGVLWATLG